MKRYSLQEVIDIVQERLNAISYHKELYKIVSKELPDDITIIDVIYKNQCVLSLHYMVTNRFIGGQMQVRAAFRVYALMYPEWYHQYKEKIDKTDKPVFVSEFDAHTSGGYKPLTSFLDEFLPLAKEEDCVLIASELDKHNITYSGISFDSYQKKYIVQLDLKEVLNLAKDNSSNEEYITLYKYMPLETYHSMLQNMTFRMNSIVSMNDVSETFWMNTLLYGNEKQSKEQIYEGVIKSKNVLISSFSDKADDPIMWRLYGNTGNGVCLGFSIKRKDVDKIYYINNADQTCAALKEIAKGLRSRNIEIIYEDNEDLQYRIKSTIYNIESEYRLIWNKEEEIEDIALYKGLLSLYKDFKYDKETGLFKDINIKLTELIIGNNIPYYESNYPLLIALSDEKFKNLVIQPSEIDSFR
jgi:hypothetical protein